MNEFNTDLLHARARQRRRHLSIFVSVSSVFFILFIIFALLKVTSVEVLPDDALQTAVVDIKKGIGFTIGSKVYRFSSGTLLDIGASGFASSTVEIPPGHSGSLQVELIELPGKLRVATNAADDAVRWLIDGQLVAVSDELSIDLNTGSYALTVDSLYYETKVVDVTLARGEEKILSINLTPVAGQMDISSIPAGMPVTIDGEAVGVTPVSSSYAGGSYVVQVLTPDFETISDRVEITNVSPAATRNYRLQAKKSYLSFSLSPTGGDLLVNGRKVDPAALVTVDAKAKNTLTYLKNGYFSESRTVTLSIGEKKKILFDLRAEKGRVEIKSQPVSDVFVDGKLRGKTPLTLSLLAVRHKVSLSRKGYRTIIKTVAPSSKKTIVVSATLQEERLAKLAEAKSDYKNSIGMAFKLFTPSRLKMGAERHEKGQRANEFVRDIVLKKPFYAGLREVTIRQYSKFKKLTRSVSPGNYPVTAISWQEAAAFCNWLSAREKLQPFYVMRGGVLKGVNKASGGYRLLTEAEWEWLARKAGRKNQTIFTWGNEFVVPPASGNIADESAGNAVKRFVPDYNDGYVKIAPVGSFIPDKSGLYDLTGNVSEWVHDYYSLVPPRKNTREIDPLGSDRGTNHVIKGSNWQSGVLTELRASFRDGAVGAREDTGFRVARYLYGEQDIE